MHHRVDREADTVYLNLTDRPIKDSRKPPTVLSIKTPRATSGVDSRCLEAVSMC